VPSATGAPRATPLLVTKLLPPAPRDIVPRPALVERLASGPARRLTLIRAPAGWGKTTLLAAWASSPAEPRPFAWLALDAGDDRPPVFWSYVVEALRTLDERLGADALALLRAPGVDAGGEALPALLNDLAALREPAVLALDDLHLVERPEIHAQLAFFAEHLPPALELAIASRAEPLLPLGRLRARGELLEIDETHLRFSARESAMLLNDVARLDLTDDEVRVLRERTEGWAAGLYLAALSLRDRPDPGRFIDAFSGDDRHVVDYLGSEVLGGLGDDVRSFLLRTSVLDRLTGPLCDAVAGGSGAARLLREIERSNLFLVALDDRRRVYRYHHLFADLLRRELELAEPGLVPELHRRASRFHRDEGDADRAIRHAIAAGDVPDAVELIAEHWSEWLLRRGQHGAIDAWLRALPSDVVRADPRLCVAATFTGHSLGRAPQVTRWVDAAEAALTAESPARLRGDVAAARASNALQTGDLARAVPAAQRALAVGDEASPWMPLPHGVLAHAARWSGDAERAVAEFEAWRRESEARGQVLGVVCSDAEIALVHAEAGRDAEAVAAAGHSREAGAGRFAEHWVSTAAHGALALVAERLGDGDAARAEARRAVELARRGGPPGERAIALLLGARVLGDAALAAEARALLAPCPDPGGMVLDRLAAAAGAPPAAREPAEGEELSERELQILRLLATDRSQREIGDALYISLNTVKTHVRHVFRKLGAAGREDAVARARRAGVLR
jgi:LuxR family maltose regulon positive regulatory protein